MERQNIIKEKSFLFAIEIVGLYNVLAQKKRVCFVKTGLTFWNTNWGKC